MAAPLFEGMDRRRRPRFACRGQAGIICLPSEGVLISGRLRDLSLSGCGIEMVSPLARGARAEITVRVQGASFRAVGQVRALRVPSGIGVEFLRLSASGQNMLEELIRELARQRAIASTLRAARREPDAELLRRQRDTLFNENPPIVGRTAGSENGEETSLVVNRRSLIIEADLDLFI